MTPQVLQLIETIIAVFIGGLAMKLIDYQTQKRRDSNKQDNHIIDQLQEELSALRERVARLEEQVEEKNNKIVVLEREKAVLQTENKYNESRIEKLERKLDEKDRLIKKLKGDEDE